MVKDRIDAFESSEFYKVWLKACRAATFFAAVLFTLLVFSSLLSTVYAYLFKIIVVVVVGSFVAFRRLKDGIEFKLIFFYCVWLVLIRLYDGGMFAENTMGTIAVRSMMLPFLGFAFLSPPEKRLKWLDAMALIYCVAYTIVGIFCIYGALYQVEIMNPLDAGIKLCSFRGGRLYVFGIVCNGVGTWYYMACAFLVYLILRHKNAVLRGIYVLCFIICYLVLALTYSRSSMVSFAVSMGMLAVILAFRHLPLHRNISKAIVLVVLMGLGTGLAYKSFDLSTTLMSEISRRVQVVEQEMVPDAQNNEKETGKDRITQQMETAERLNERGFSSSGRVELWIDGIKALREDPGRILTGRVDAMDLTNQYIEENDPVQFERYGDRANHHNAYMDFLMISGLPGFLLTMCFFVILVIKMIRLFFIVDCSIMLEVKALTIMLTGIMVYNLFETAFFDNIICTTVFSMVSGYILIYEKELRGRTSV